MDGTNSFTQNFKLIPPGSPFAILIRHAERPKFRVRQLGYNVPITESGASASLKFGGDPFLKTINAAYSSPILRCVQTANKILEGARLDGIKVTTRTTLGEPGSYISNRWAAGRYFMMKDAPSVIEEYITKGKLDGFLSVKEGSIALISSIMQDMAGKDSRHLYVSHDAVIVPFINYFIGEKFDPEHWLDFLDGIIITALDGEISMIRNGKEYSISTELYTNAAEP
jgi:broad specificity phosphatase PhoE